LALAVVPLTEGLATPLVAVELSPVLLPMLVVAALLALLKVELLLLRLRGSRFLIFPEDLLFVVWEE